MRRPRVDEVCRCELVDVAKPLHGRRVDHTTLLVIEADKLMHRVTYLVDELSHDAVDPIWNICSTRHPKRAD